MPRGRKRKWVVRPELDVSQLSAQPTALTAPSNINEASPAIPGPSPPPERRPKGTKLTAEEKQSARQAREKRKWEAEKLRFQSSREEDIRWAAEYREKAKQRAALSHARFGVSKRNTRKRSN